MKQTLTQSGTDVLKVVEILRMYSSGLWMYSSGLWMYSSPSGSVIFEIFVNLKMEAVWGQIYKRMTEGVRGGPC